MGPIVLIILDGWGYRADTTHNAIAHARKPHWDAWWDKHPHTLLDGSGHAVGLPDGQMGNSEVGHLNIGAGRVVHQSYTRIEQAIAEGSLAYHPLLSPALDRVIAEQRAVHIMGLLSPGGVHSHEDQIFALIRLLQQRGVQQIYLHAFLDGRDTPPKSAQASLLRAMETFGTHGRVLSCTGRYYAMDRDHRWDRTQRAYQLIVDGEASFQAETPLAALEAAYARGETDEFIQPTQVGAPAPMVDGDLVLFANFRADRARQLSDALVQPTFTGFIRSRAPAITLVTLTNYDEQLPAIVLFPPETHAHVLAEVLQDHGLRQLHIAETEKYAHVTFFFNGGVEAPFRGEERILVPSPKVATYDLQPAMSAITVADHIVASIVERRHDVIIANFANADMVGHTGHFDATVACIETLDICLGRIYTALMAAGGEGLVTADHGNAECLYDEGAHQPHTSHTTNPVPCLYWGQRTVAFRPEGTLADVAPTLLHLLGIASPIEMTGKTLFTILR